MASRGPNRRVGVSRSWGWAQRSRAGRLAIGAAALSLPLALLPVAVPPALAQSTSGGTISTVAGGVGGPGSPKTIAQQPDGLLVDGGSLYISDAGNAVVRALTVSGGTATETVVAGDAVEGDTGDGGLPTAASLSTPAGLALDAAGNLLIADSGAGVIRMIAKATCTASSSSTCAYGLPATTAGDIYTIAGGGPATTTSGTPSPTTGVPALDVPPLAGPDGIVIDPAGNVLIAERTGSLVQMIAATTCSSSCAYGLTSTTAGDMYTIAGTGTAGVSADATSDSGGAATAADLNAPSGLALVGSGVTGVDDLLVAEAGIDPVSSSTGLTAVQLIAGATCTSSCPFGLSTTAGDIYTIAGNGTPGHTENGGLATSAELNGASGVAMDAHGNLLIADTFNNEIRMVAAKSCSSACPYGLATTAGDIYTILGPSAKPAITTPVAVAVDSVGNVLIGAAGADTVDMLAESTTAAYGVSSPTKGTAYVLAGDGYPSYAGDQGPATAAQLSAPSGVAVRAGGGYVIADTKNNTVRYVPGTSCATSSCPFGLTSTTAGDIYTIAGTGTAGPPKSSTSSTPVAATAAPLAGPDAVAVDAHGNVLVAEASAQTISGTSLATVPGDVVQLVAASSCSSSCPYGLASMTAGDIYTIAGTGASGDGASGGVATSTELDNPGGLAVDASGNVVIADTGNNLVRLLAATSCHSSSCPYGLTSMTAGDLYTIAGGGSSAPSTTAAAATSLELASPTGLALAPTGTANAGDVLVADAGYTYTTTTGTEKAGELAPGSDEVLALDPSTGDAQVVVGNGAPSPTGDGIAASSAGISDPTGVAEDPKGNILVAVAGSAVVRVVFAAAGTEYGVTGSAGDIYTIAGTGTPGFSGDGGPATQAEIDDPAGIALTSSAVLIADSVANRVRSVTSGTFTAATTPTVTGVSPVSGTQDGGTAVTITGTGFLGASAVDFGTVPAETFHVASATSITATSPSSSTTGPVDITVTTPGGTSATSSADQFTYTAGTAVTGISPPSGPQKGGTIVTLDGTGFTGATAVTFAGTKATSFDCSTDTTCTAVSPPGTGTAGIQVTSPAGTSLVTSASEFTYLPAPALTAITPAEGPLAGGNSVTLTGTNLTGASSATFGSKTATALSCSSSTTCTATVPPGSALGGVPVAITTPGGTSPASSAPTYTYVAPPSITSISPPSGNTGTVVTFTGQNFTGPGYSAPSAIDFGSAAATAVSCTSATSCTATAPAGSGTESVFVTTPGGTGTLSDSFTYPTTTTTQPLPTISGVSPAEGPLVGGTPVTITGTYLTGASAVEFGSHAGADLVCSTSTTCTVDSPAEAAGTVAVTVTTTSGSSTGSSSDQSQPFTFVPTPVVTGVATSPTPTTPPAGPLGGGNTLVVSGSNLTGASAVDFNSTPGTIVSCATGGASCTVTAPKVTSAGIENITITTPGGVSAVTSTDEYTYLLAPQVTALSLPAGPLSPGTALTVSGLNFEQVSGVRFNGPDGDLAATGVTCSTTTGCALTSPSVTAPEIANVVVTTPGGTSAASSLDEFAYQAVPAVTGVSPVAGPAGGGTSVTITGTAFTRVSAIDFGTTAARSFTCSADATTCTAVSPFGSGTQDIRVTTPGGTSPVVTADEYTFLQPPPPPPGPSVTGVSPSTGPPTGGTTVTITGTDFDSVSAVDFGTVPATSYTMVSATQIQTVSPAGTSGATVNVTVTTPYGTSGVSTADEFSYATVTPGYVPLVPPVRILDTRPTSQIGALTGPLQPGTVYPVQVAGEAGIPSTATAVAVNVTAVTPSTYGFLQVYPAGGSAGSTSTINYQPDQTTANFVVVALPADGIVDVYSKGASVNVLFDVVGYFNPHSGYTATTPIRILDTRTGSGHTQGLPDPLRSDTAYPVQVTGLGGVPADATAVAVNLTAISPSSVGNLRAYPDGSALPTTSNINYTPGVDQADFAVIALPANGKIELYSNTPRGGTVNVAVDVVGYLTSSTTAVIQAPVRILDTRSGSGLTQGLPDPLQPGVAYPIHVSGLANVATGATAAFVTVTAISPAGHGDLRVYPTGAGLPNVSTINYIPGQTTANFTIAALSPDGEIDLYSDGSATNVTVDVVGYVASPG